ASDPQVKPLSVECCPSRLAPHLCSAKNRTCALAVPARHRHTTCVVEVEQCEDAAPRVYVPSRTPTLCPERTTSAACWMVANGCEYVPGLLSEPPGPTQ